MINADNLDKYAGDLSRGIELALALTALGGKVAHQVFVCVTQNIISAGLVGTKIKLRTLEYDDQPGEFVNHLLALAQLGLIVEMGIVDYAAQLIVSSFGQLSDHLIHAFADVFGAFQRNHIIKAATLWHSDVSIFHALELICDILHEKQSEDIVFVYRYGKERGIEVSGYRPAIADANEIANGLDSTLKYYRRWIDKGNALPMLARFFNR